MKNRGIFGSLRGCEEHLFHLALLASGVSLLVLPSLAGRSITPFLPSLSDGISPVCLCHFVQISPFNKDTGHTGLGPILTTSH